MKFVTRNLFSKFNLIQCKEDMFASLNNINRNNRKYVIEKCSSLTVKPDLKESIENSTAFHYTTSTHILIKYNTF